MTTPQRIPIPSDLVLRIDISDLYNQDGESIDISSLAAVNLTFVCGGEVKTFELKPAGNTATAGATIVSPEDGKPYIVVCLCTDGFKPGDLFLKSEVHISDSRFHDNVRKELTEVSIPIKLV